MNRGVLAATAAFVAFSVPASAATVTLDFSDGSFTLQQEDEFSKTYISHGITFLTTGAIVDGVVVNSRLEGSSNSALVLRFGPYVVNSVDVSGLASIDVKHDDTLLATINPGATFQTFGPYAIPDPGGLFFFSDATTSIDNVVISIADVPEPATWAMMIAGFGLAGAAARRRQRPAVAIV